MEQQDPTQRIQGEGLEGTGKDLHVAQVGSTGEGLHKIPGAQPVKQEPCEGLLQHWEAQWQEFLKSVESPQSHWAIPQMLEEPTTPWGNPKAFLATFEQVAEACQWPKEEWAIRLLPALCGEAEQAFSRLKVRDREDYGKQGMLVLINAMLFNFACLPWGPGLPLLMPLFHGHLPVLRRLSGVVFMGNDMWNGLFPSTFTQASRSAPKAMQLAQSRAVQLVAQPPQKAHPVTPEVTSSWPQQPHYPIGKAPPVWVLTLLAEAAVSFSEAGQAPGHSGQKQLCLDTKKEDEEETSSLAVKGYLNISAEQKYNLDGSEPGRPYGTSVGRAEENISPYGKQDNFPEKWHRREFQETHPEKRIHQSDPCMERHRVVGESTVQQKIHHEYRQMRTFEENNAQQESLEQISWYEIRNHHAKFTMQSPEADLVACSTVQNLQHTKAKWEIEEGGDSLHLEREKDCHLCLQVSYPLIYLPLEPRERRTPAQQKVKQEPGEGLLQCWEAQWQQFLKEVESPHSRWGLLQLPEEPAPWDDAVAFLASFEQVAEACRWPRGEWVTRLLPALSGQAEWTFSGLDVRDKGDYGKELMLLEEGAGNFPDAETAPLNPSRDQPHREAKEERDSNSSLLDCSQMNNRQEIPEQIVTAWACKRRATETCLHSPEPGTVSQNQHRPKISPGNHVRNRPVPSISSTTNWKIINETPSLQMQNPRV
uniref:Uncharacterized protein n=1 Tax=Sphaerodactylus townsendi TaxID=933632 RepID=A0ACB8EFG7_9SAUR